MGSSRPNLPLLTRTWPSSCRSCCCLIFCVFVLVFVFWFIFLLVSIDQDMVVGFGYFSITCIYNLSFFRSYLIALFIWLWKTSAEEHRAGRGTETEPCGPLSHWYPDEKWIWEKVQCENSFPTKTTKCLKIRIYNAALSTSQLPHLKVNTRTDPSHSHPKA